MGKPIPCLCTYVQYAFHSDAYVKGSVNVHSICHVVLLSTCGKSPPNPSWPGLATVTPSLAKCTRGSIKHSGSRSQLRSTVLYLQPTLTSKPSDLQLPAVNRIFDGHRLCYPGFVDPGVCYPGLMTPIFVTRVFGAPNYCYPDFCYPGFWWPRFLLPGLKWLVFILGPLTGPHRIVHLWRISSVRLHLLNFHQVRPFWP